MPATLPLPVYPAPGLALRVHGMDLRISLGAEVKAERVKPGHRVERVWPPGRMLAPAPLNSPGGPHGFRNSGDWPAPPDDRWDAVFSNVGLELMAVIARFPGAHWPLLEFAHNHASFRDLLASNPVLAYALACNDQLHDTPPDFAARRAVGYSHRRQRDIAGLLGFPATEATVKLFKRLLPEAVSPSILRLLRGSLPLGGRLAKLVAHADGLNAGVLSFLIYPPLRDRLTSRLMADLTEGPLERTSAPTADLLLDTFQMLEGLATPRALPALFTCAQVREIHDRVLLEHLAQQELLRREREAQEARAQERAVRAEAQRLRRTAERRARAAAEAGIGQEPAAPAARSSVKYPRNRFPAPPIPGTSMIVPIESEADLALEGLDQLHCAAALALDVRLGHLYVYRVLWPQRATLSIKYDGRRWRIKQLRLKANAPASEQTSEFVRKWLTPVAPSIEVSRPDPGDEAGNFGVLL